MRLRCRAVVSRGAAAVSVCTAALLAALRCCRAAPLCRVALPSCPTLLSHCAAVSRGAAVLPAAAAGSGACGVAATWPVPRAALPLPPASSCFQHTLPSEQSSRSGASSGCPLFPCTSPVQQGAGASGRPSGARGGAQRRVGAAPPAVAVRRAALLAAGGRAGRGRTLYDCSLRQPHRSDAAPAAWEPLLAPHSSSGTISCPYPLQPICAGPCRLPGGGAGAGHLRQAACGCVGRGGRPAARPQRRAQRASHAGGAAAQAACRVELGAGTLPAPVITCAELATFLTVHSTVWRSVRRFQHLRHPNRQSLLSLAVPAGEPPGGCEPDGPA